MDQKHIFSFLFDTLSAGKKAALVTVVSVEGSSMRDIGAHMAVNENGDYVGSLSGGCIENAVIAEAMDTIESNIAKTIRFGHGSPYIDIKLPCGGGLDIHFLPLDNIDLIAACLTHIHNRQPYSIRFSETTAHFIPYFTPLEISVDLISIGYLPPPKLIIIGHGASVSSLANLADNMRLEIEILTPDMRLLTDYNAANYSKNKCGKKDFNVQKLPTPNDIDLINSDRWSAIIFLFHDHDWEIELMAHALSQPQFYIGAMGSRKAHQLRCDMLLEKGIDQELIDNIYAPIGLFHSSRDPDTLALSALAEIMKYYHQYDFSKIIPDLN